MTPEQILQELIIRTKYTRWNYLAGRRETWHETVERVMHTYEQLADGALPNDTLNEIEDAIYRREAFGSMRMLRMAGEAFERDNITGYNCAAMPIESIPCFHDLMALGMSGVGVTVSVEKRFIEKLPSASLPRDGTHTIYVADTSEGWAWAIHDAICAAYSGYSVYLDTSDVRPAGAILRTKGGRASGPEPLREAVDHIVAIIHNAAGRKLTDVEVADICCWIGNATVQGGVRRTALMVIGDRDSEGILNYKSGNWYNDPDRVVRRNANIDVVLDGTETRQQFDALMERVLGYGDLSFFNRTVALSRMSERRRELCSRPEDVLPNPCVETELDPYGLCNLSVFVARPDLEYHQIAQRAQVAAILGVLQSKATHFPDLWLPQWQANAERLRLCGVSPTGMADTPVLNNPHALQQLRYTIETIARVTANDLGIPIPASFTAIKPAGNTSLATNTSPGLNPRHYRYAKRRITFKRGDPVLKVLSVSGVPIEESIYDTNEVFAVFPIAAPAGARVVDEMSAIEQMERYLTALENYSDQAVSTTIMFTDGEQEDITDWLWAHRKRVVSMAFMRKVDANYPQLIIEKIEREEYERLVRQFPQRLSWGMLSDIEREDHIEADEGGCGGGTCTLM